MKVEGKNPVKELLNSDATIESILIENGNKDQVLREIQKLARDRGIKVEFVDKRGLDRQSETGHHQGVIANYTNFEYSKLEDLIEKARANNEDMLFIILDEILDPHNLGSIIRVAECAGATGVIISNRRSATVNETVVRTSAGATAYVPVVKVGNINQAIETLKNNGVWIYSLDMEGQEMYKTNLKGNIALVVGNEGSGVKNLTIKNSDGVISIPMYGQVNSLNASVSAGIAIYEVLRQRRM